MCFARVSSPKVASLLDPEMTGKVLRIFEKLAAVDGTSDSHGQDPGQDAQQGRLRSTRAGLCGVVQRVRDAKACERGGCQEQPCPSSCQLAML